MLIMVLEHFNPEYSSRLLVVQDHMVPEHMVQGMWSWVISRGQNFKKARGSIESPKIVKVGKKGEEKKKEGKRKERRKRRKERGEKRKSDNFKILLVIS